MGYTPSDHHVRVYQATPGHPLKFDFQPYGDGWFGGARAATGDFNADGIPDIVTAPGPGGTAHVKVFRGNANGTEPELPQDVLWELNAFGAFGGGAYVATGDVNGDGRSDVVVAAGEGGGPHVKVFNGVDGSLIRQFQAWNETEFTGGVRLAVADFDGDGDADIAAAQGPVTAPKTSSIRIFNGLTPGVVGEFQPYPGFTGGVYVAAGDVNADGRADLITGAGPGGLPHVKAFDGARLNELSTTPPPELANFQAYGAFGGGVRVASGDFDGDAVAEIITAPGPGGGAHVKVFRPGGQEIYGFMSTSFQGGIYVDGEAAQQARAHIPILDNVSPADSTFSLTGAWNYAPDSGFSRDVHWIQTAGATATWNFSGLTPGRYRIAATWADGGNRTAQANYSIIGGPTVALSQKDNPLRTHPGSPDFADAGVNWRMLADSFEITGSTLSVQLSHTDSDVLIADAIRIQRLRTVEDPPPSSLIPVNGVFVHTFAVANSPVTATSSNTGLVPNENIVISGTGSSQTITVTPIAGQSGVTTITLTSSDGTFQTSNTFDLTVTDNQAPVLGSIGNKTIPAGTTLAFRVQATDMDPLDNLSYALDWYGTDGQLTGTPWNVKFDGSTGIFLWAPDESQDPGVYSAIVRATDNGDVPRTDSETFQITVNEQNLRPTIQGPGYPAFSWPRAIQVGFSSPTDPAFDLRFSVSSSDNDQPDQNRTYELLSGSRPGQSFNTGTGEYVWLVPANTPVSTIDLKFRVHDNGPSPKTHDVVVPIAIMRNDQLVNHAPVANADSWEVGHGGTLQGVNVLENDSWNHSANQRTISFTPLPPSQGSLSVDQAGNLTYQAPANFADVVTVSYTITDEHQVGYSLSHTTTVQLHVTNRDPAAASHDYTVDQWDTLSVPALTGVLSGISDEGDTLKVAEVTIPPAHAETFSLNVSDGSFLYKAKPGFKGRDQFVVKIDETNAALQKYWENIGADFQDDRGQYGIVDIYVLEHVETGPQAGNDEFDVVFDADDQTFEFFVLLNDGHTEGDSLEIIDVSSTTEGASVWINPDSGSIFYQPPEFPPAELSMGGVITLGEDIPESTGSPQLGLEGGFAPFDDTFTYTVTDSMGRTASALVQVKMQQAPEWKAGLKDKFKEAAEVGIDGKPGYKLQILQVFGANARGLKALARTQTWQKNTIKAVNMYVDAQGAFKQETTPEYVLLDTQDIREGLRTPLEISDTLGLDPSAKASKTVMIIEFVTKKLGLNKPGETLRTPVKQPWKPNAMELQAVEQMQSPFLELDTLYFFLDKKLLLELHTQGKITNQELDAIKATVNANNLNFDALPDVYESYVLGALKFWEYKS